MGHERAVLSRDQSAGQSPIHVPNDHHDVGIGLLEQQLEGYHGARGLISMSAAADTESVVGGADVELLEEYIVHRSVIMLAGVHEHDLDASGAQRAHDRFDLHVVRTGTSNTHDPG